MAVVCVCVVEDESSTFVLFLVRPAFSMFRATQFFTHTAPKTEPQRHNAQSGVRTDTRGQRLRPSAGVRSNQRRERAKKSTPHVHTSDSVLHTPTSSGSNCGSHTSRPRSRPRMAMRAQTAPGVTRTAHGERAAVATLDGAAACACRHSTRRSSVRCHERSSTHRAGAPHVHLVRADATHRAPRSRHSVGQRWASYLVPPARPCSAQHLGRPTGTACSRHRARESLSELSDMCTRDAYNSWRCPKRETYERAGIEALRRTARDRHGLAGSRKR